MNKQFTDEKTGINYILHGDYYLPDLALPKTDEDYTVGVHGERHRRYIKAHKKAMYTELLTSGKLQAYIANVNEQAEKRFELLVQQLAEKENVTEKLKAENQMEWVQKMNMIRLHAQEIVNEEIIYV
ncbi:MAG: TnpV protein [Christensenellales bacterium]